MIALLQTNYVGLSCYFMKQWGNQEDQIIRGSDFMGGIEELLRKLCICVAGCQFQACKASNALWSDAQQRGTFCCKPTLACKPQGDQHSDILFTAEDQER